MNYQKVGKDLMSQDEIAILDGEKHQMRRKEIIEITKNYI